MAPRKPKDPDTKPPKTATVAKPTTKAQPTVATSEPTSAGSAAPTAKGSIIKLKDLIESVSDATGAKKPEVKKAIEATLAAIGQALATGSSLVIPPLGKLRVVKNNGPAMTLKLRLADSAKAAGLALADDSEDS